MKKSKILILMAASFVFALGGCSNPPASSGDGFSYDPLSSVGAEGYIFDMDEKYTLKTTIIDKINSFNGDYNINNIKSLVDVIGDNDFYTNKLVETIVDVDVLGMVDGNNVYGEDNHRINSSTTIQRDNSNHTLSGTTSLSSINAEGEKTLSGTYSLTYDEGLFKAIENWVYDDDTKETKEYILNDEFVENHLALINAKECFQHLIEQYENTSFFNAKDIVLIDAGDNYIIKLDRSKTLVEENVRFDQVVSMSISKLGYVNKIIQSYIVRDGGNHNDNILIEETVTKVLSVI